MQAGKFRYSVDLLRNQPIATDDAGAPVPNWVKLATVWAFIRPLGGGETWHGNQATAESTHRVEMRYNTIAQAQMRLAYGLRTFEINNVNDTDERHIELVLNCKELVG
jgi:SPP1 family predicted phage head-tail adaptor